MIECLIVISIMGILSLPVVAGFNQQMDKQLLYNTSKLLLSDLYIARMHAMQTDCDILIVADLTGYQIKRCLLDGDLSIVKTSLYPKNINGTSAKLGYKSSGNPKYSGSIILSTKNGRRVRISVSPVTGKATEYVL